MGLNNLREKASEKADRKFEKKVQFYSKVRSQTIAVTQTTKTKSKSAKRRAKKLKAFDLSTLTELLPELKIEKREAPSDKFKLNCKSRQKILLKEGKQFESVVNHPAFNSDPFAAIHQHLQNTQPVIEAPEEKKMTTKKMTTKKMTTKKIGLNGKARKRAKKRAAALSGHQSVSMEI